MHIWKTSRKFGQTVRRWRDLAEHRREAFAELYDSGDWIKHYTEAAFRLRMREVIASAKRWDEIVAALPADPALTPGRPATQPQKRAAA
jgi:hypothetical protein